MYLHMYIHTYVCVYTCSSIESCIIPFSGFQQLGMGLEHCQGNRSWCIPAAWGSGQYVEGPPSTKSGPTLLHWAPQSTAQHQGMTAKCRRKRGRKTHSAITPSASPALQNHHRHPLTWLRTSNKPSSPPILVTEVTIWTSAWYTIRTYMTDLIWCLGLGLELVFGLWLGLWIRMASYMCTYVYCAQSAGLENAPDPYPSPSCPLSLPIFLPSLPAPLSLLLIVSTLLLSSH